MNDWIKTLVLVFKFAESLFIFLKQFILFYILDIYFRSCMYLYIYAQIC